MTFMPDPTYGELSAQLRHAQRRLVQLATSVARTVATMPIVATTTIDLKTALLDCGDDMRPNAEEMALGQAIDAQRTAYRRTAVERECGEAPEGLGGLRCTRPQDHAGPHVHVPVRAAHSAEAAAERRTVERRLVAAARTARAILFRPDTETGDVVLGRKLALDVAEASALEPLSGAADFRAAETGAVNKIGPEAIAGTPWSSEEAAVARTAARVHPNLDRVMRIVNALQQPRVVSVDVDRQFVYFDRDEKTGRWRVTYTKILLNEG